MRPPAAVKQKTFRPLDRLGYAIATGLGVLLGLMIERQIPWEGLAVPAAVWALTVAGPKLVTRRWGFVSLASITTPWPLLATAAMRSSSIRLIRASMSLA